MSIKLVLYGDLKQKGQKHAFDNSNPLIINLPYEKIDNVYDILEKLNIRENEISHVFVNHNYCGLGIEVKDEDRVALFPRRMAVIFEEIPHSNSIELIVRLSTDLRKYGQEISLIDIPKGSNIIDVVKKYNLSSEKRLKILVNGIPCYNNRHILKEKDVIEIFLSLE